MAIISLEEFKTIMGDLMIASDTVRAIDDTIRNTPVMKSASDFFSASALILPNADMVVSLLETMFDDTEEHWISYWMFEQDFGRSWEQGIATEADGSDIDLSSSEKLYAYLLKNMGR